MRLRARPYPTMSLLVRFFAVCFLAAPLIASSAAFAAESDIEAKTGDGRRVLLSPSGTWRYAEGEAPSDAKEDGPQAALQLEKRIERGNNCRFEMRLVNN